MTYPMPTRISLGNIHYRNNIDITNKATINSNRFGVTLQSGKPIKTEVEWGHRIVLSVSGSGAGPTHFKMMNGANDVSL